jgi:DNA repair exonuclease SbcCD ATPase subunit
MSELEEAEHTERELREQIADLVSARARAQSEAMRLAGRASLEGADPTLAEIAERYRLQATRLGGEIDAVRGSLREHEADLERLRAQSRGV